MLALLAGPIKAALSPQVCQVQQTGLTCDAQTAHPTRFMPTARINFYLPERPLDLLADSVSHPVMLAFMDCLACFHSAHPCPRRPAEVCYISGRHCHACSSPPAFPQIVGRRSRTGPIFRSYLLLSYITVPYQESPSHNPFSAVLIYQPLLFSLPHPQLVHVSIPPPYV